jgi:hypothetical protein
MATLALLPMPIIMITDETPMMIPTLVRAALILFFKMALAAVMTAFSIFMDSLFSSRFFQVHIIPILLRY